MGTLKKQHLVPYLLYKIKVKWFREDDNSFQTSELTIDDYPFLSNRLLKPILRPLSDFTKKIEHDGVVFTPAAVIMAISTDSGDVYWHDYIGCHRSEYGEILEAPYWMVEKLFEWHFDVRELIPKELAIDINTIK